MSVQLQFLRKVLPAVRQQFAFAVFSCVMLLTQLTSVNAQTFSAVQTNPFSLSGSGQIKEPVLVDIDNDGDLDIFAIRNTNDIYFWQNDGTSSSPSYNSPQMNPFGLSPNLRLSICFADLNGDGDKDFFQVDNMNNISMYENMGDANNPAFGPSTPSPYNLYAQFNSIAMADYDKDGLIDIINGREDGNIESYKNFGNAYNPSFSSPEMNPDGMQGQSTAIFPELADIDGDLDIDFICGMANGDFIYYQNTGNLYPDFSFSAQTNPFGLTALSGSNTLCVGDINGDLTPDILSLASGSPTFNYFSNSLAPSAPPAPTDQTTPANKLICSGNSTTLFISGTATGVLSWYSAATGGDYLGVGDSYTTGILTSNTSFFAQDSNSIGASQRREIIVEMKTSTVQPLNTTSPSDLKACVGGTTSLSVNGEPIGNITWWSASTGGTLLGIGNPFTTPVIIGETTFFVQDSTCGGVTPRTPITVTIKQTPPAPMNNTMNWVMNVCPGDFAALQGYSTENGNLSWWSAATGGTLLGTGETFLTPAIYAVTTYYLQDSTCGGISTRTPITITLNIPSAPTNGTSSNNLSICPGTGTTLNGSGSGNLSWWTASTGGTFLYAGAYFFTGNINSSTTYYLQDSACGGASVRTPITVSMALPPNAPSYSSANLVACLGNSTDLHGYGVSGGALSWWTAATSGTRLYNGVVFITPAINAPTTFYLQDSACGGTSVRTAIAVTLAQPPAEPTITNWGSGLITCGGGTVNLNGNPATGWGNFSWWSAPSGGTRLYNGNPFTTPPIFAPTTFYLQDSACGGASVRTAITVAVEQPPAAPTNTSSGSNMTTCYGGTTTLYGIGDSQSSTLTWWSAPSGGTLLGTGISFTTSAIFAPTTFYLQDSTCGGNSLTRTAITVSLATPTAAPLNTTNLSNMTACPGSSTILQGSGVSGGALSWWSASTGGVRLENGTDFTTPAINAETTFYLQDSACGGFSARTAVIVTLKQFTATPSNATSSTNMFACEGGTTTLSGSGSLGGQLTWWSAETGGTLLGSGINFTTPAINAETTFYLQDSTCVGLSVRTTVTVSLNSITINLHPSSASVYFNQPYTFSVNASSLNLTYQWTVNGVNVSGATSNEYTKAGTSTIHTDTIRCIVSNGCTSVTSNPAYLSVEMIPSFVDGVNGNDIYDGSSWQNAFKTIDKAMQVASSGKQIFVKKGIYHPSLDENYATPITWHEQTKTFAIKSGVSLIGGFAGTETYKTERVNYGRGEINETTLEAADAYFYMGFQYRSNHVVYFNNVSSQTQLDGFSITKGMAYANNSLWYNNINHLGAGIINIADGAGNSSNPIISNCYVYGNYGSTGNGIHNSAANTAHCNPLIENCTFTENTGSGLGGAICNWTETNGVLNSMVKNCKFINNDCQQGGTIYNKMLSGSGNVNFVNCLITGSDAQVGIITNLSTASSTLAVNIVNCAITGNSMTGGGNGCMLNDGTNTTLNVMNSILWKNVFYTQIENISGATSNTTYSLVQDVNDANPAHYNLDGVTNTADINYPKFMNPTDANFRLVQGSPCINVGNNTANSTYYDIANQSRVQNGTIDLGPYEGEFTPCSTDTTIVNVAGCNGSSVTVGGTSYTSSDINIQHLAGLYGCDSIVKTIITFYDTEYSSQDLTLCYGESVTVGTSVYTVTGEYYDTFTSIHGCDSTVTTYITMKPLVAGLLNHSVTSCTGTPLTLDASYDALGYNDDHYPKTPSMGLVSSKQKITVETMVFNANNDPNALYNLVYSPSMNNYVFELSNNSIRFENGEDAMNATYPSIPARQWVHVAFVFDGSASTLADNYKVYVNGVSQTLTFSGSSVNIGTTPLSSTQFTIGNNLSGKMRNVRFWSDAHTLSQIQESMAANHISNGGANYAIEYLMHETSGSIVQNTSGTGASYNISLGSMNAGSWSGMDTATCWINQTYSWSDGITNGVAFTPTASHNYVVTITNPISLCTMTDTMHVTINNPVTSTQTLVECAPFSVTVGTHTYNTTGIYTDVLVSAAGCDSVITTNLTINANPVPSITGSLSYCVGTNTTLDAGVYTSFLWSTGAITQTINATTVNNPISVTVTNASGCTASSASVNVAENASLNPVISGSLSYCAGSNTTLDAGVFTTYLWSNGATTQTVNVTAGTYSVYVENGTCNGTSANVVVTENANPVPSITGSLSYCVGTNTTLDAGVYTSYVWSTGAITQSVVATTANNPISVTVTNASGCTASSASVNVAESAGLSPVISGSLSYCAGSNTTLDAGIFTTYLWSNGATTQTINVTVGTYSVYVENGTCNGTSANVVVTENANPTVTISGVLNYCAGSNAILDAGANTSFLWSTGAITQTINATTVNNPISVTVTNASGCTATSLPVSVTSIVVIPTTQTFVEYNGFTVTVGSHTYDSTGVYVDTIPSASGCDSIVTTNLTIHPVAIYQPCGPVSYTIPVGAFDPINIATASFTVTLANGNPLPSWLTFDSATLTFSGTAPCVDTLYNIIVSCSGTAKIVVNFEFTLQIGNVTSVATIVLSDVTIFPNPTNGIVNIKFTGTPIEQVIILDITGKILISKMNLKDAEMLDLSGFESGIYFIQLITNDKIKIAKIVKQ